MANQDLVLSVLPRLAPPVPLSRDELAAVGALVKRPVVEEDWDRKQPVKDDRIFDPKPPTGDSHGQGQPQSQQHGAEPGAAANSDASPTTAEPGHIDTFV